MKISERAMTEKEKRDAGELYRPADPELSRELLRANDLCLRLNETPVSRPTERAAILKELFGAIGAGSNVLSPFRCDYGSQIRIGADCFFNYNVVVLDCASVTFGDRVLVAPGCGFFTAGHPLDAGLRSEGLEFARPITVGSDVWFGGNVTVLPGVTIGDGAVIGGGSVVKNDVPPYTVAAGNPARVIRSLEKPGGGKKIG